MLLSVYLKNFALSSHIVLTFIPAKTFMAICVALKTGECAHIYDNLQMREEKIVELYYSRFCKNQITTPTS